LEETDSGAISSWPLHSGSAKADDWQMATTVEEFNRLNV
jgi:hypothetical protein